MLLLHNTPEYANALKNAYRQFPAKDSTLDIDFINNRNRVAGVYSSEPRINLLYYSEDLTQAAWVKDGVSATATYITESASSGLHNVNQNVPVVSVGRVFTFTVDVKADTRSRIALTGYGEALPVFDLASGTIVTTGGAANVTITPIGGGVYRCSATFTKTNAVGVFYVLLVSTGTSISYAGDGVSGLYCYKLQLNYGPTAQTYLPTTSSPIYAGGALEGVTFTRSTTATYFGSDGLLKTAAVNEPRFEYDPVSLRPLGLLIEGPRANTIRNNTMMGAVAGTPGTLPTNWGEIGAGLGTLTRTISLGTENGIGYIDFRFSGTTSTVSVGYAFEAIGGIVASNGQTWTSSFYTKLVAGSTSNTTVSNLVEQRTSAGVFLQNDTSPITLTNSLARSVYPKTLNAGATVGQVRNGFILTFSSGVAIDITIRVGLPQLELGSFATSVIPTTGTTVTCGADVASMTGANFSSWYNQSEGSVTIDFDSVGSLSDNRIVLSISDNTFNNSVYLTAATSTATNSSTLHVMTGGVAQAILSAGAYTNYSRRVVAIGLQPNNTSAQADGLTPQIDTSCLLPTVTQLVIGDNWSNSGTNKVSGHIQRVTYYPKRLPNNLLQYLSRLTA